MNFTFFIDKEDFKKSMNLPPNLDYEQVETHIEKAYRTHLKRYFPKRVLEELYTAELWLEGRRLFREALAGYAYIMTVPLLQVKLSNAGVHEYTTEQMKKAERWAVRDYTQNIAMSSERAKSEAIEELRGLLEKYEVDFYPELSIKWVQKPQEFNAYYDIGNSYEIFEKLVSNLERCIKIKIIPKINLPKDENTISEELWDCLRGAAVFLVLMELTEVGGGLCFLDDGLRVKYESFSWNKSQIISNEQLVERGKKYQATAQEYMDTAVKILKKQGVAEREAPQQIMKAKSFLAV